MKWLLTYNLIKYSWDNHSIYKEEICDSYDDVFIRLWELQIKYYVIRNVKMYPLDESGKIIK